MVGSLQLRSFARFPLSDDGRSRTRFFGDGEVRLAVLSLLGDEPRHGYGLMKDLVGRLGDLYRGSAGTVYPTLKQLEREGLVQSTTKEGRNVFRLTKEGRKVIVAEAGVIDGIWSRASEWQGLGQQMGPHVVVIASPLEELTGACLAAAQWSAGSAEHEDAVRAILRETTAKLRKLTEARNDPA